MQALSIEYTAVDICPGGSYSLIKNARPTGATGYEVEYHSPMHPVLPPLQGWRDPFPTAPVEGGPLQGPRSFQWLVHCPLSLKGAAASAFTARMGRAHPDRARPASKKDGAAAPSQHFDPSVRQASARSLNPEFFRLSYALCWYSRSRSSGVFSRASDAYPPLLFRVGCRAKSTLRTSVS